MPQPRDRSHETIINEALSRFLRDRCNLDAVAETLRDDKQPDIIVRLAEAPVLLETEVHPALTVEADALSRLGMEIDGKKVQNVYAVTIPLALRSVPQQHLFDRMGTATLVWQEWRSDGTSGPRNSGTAMELGNAVSRTIPPAGDLDEAVDALYDGSRRAGSLLYTSPGTVGRVAKVFGVEPSDDVANMAALIVINAMVFQERLASDLMAFQPVSAAMRDGRFSRIELLRMWDEILREDYYPIFSMARNIVARLSGVEAEFVLDECARTAAALLRMGAVGRHDLAGQSFNKLIAERKLLAAFYTSIPASTLLAGLALSPHQWNAINWSEGEDIADLVVVDPACGTGTLLMAAYRQILQNHTTAAAHPGNDLLHKALVEKVIMGADVVQAATHLTAATLAAMSPSVQFKEMQLHTFKLGTEEGKDLQGGESRDVHLGSLDWLKASEIQSQFSATEEQIGATSGTGSIVQRPRADLVISNPPFTRRGSDGGKEEAISRVFSLPEGDEKGLRAIAKRTSDLLRGTEANQMAGHASSFTVLADRVVKRGGRIAMVLPVTALSGESWRDVRGMLAHKYEIEIVVSSHDPSLRTLSYDTGIAEMLLVARRLTEGQQPSRRGKFVNLWRAPRLETDALALVRAVNAVTASPLLRSDGPPIGGSALMIGGEQWGECVDGPVGAAPWAAARWKRALTGQFATALERGEIWTSDGSFVAGRLPVATLVGVCNVGPQHRQIRGSIGVFDGYRGYNESAQFPALWSLDSSIHQGMYAEPNAWLVPQPDRDHLPIWSQAGTLQIAADVRYNSQRIMTTRTNVRALGIRAWHTLRVHDDHSPIASSREVALALWCNSTLGMLLHANHSNRTQQGRGLGSKGMLESLITLDVRKLEAWQLEEADTIWREFRDRKFQPFHQCAVDPVRIELDERLVRDVLGLGEDAVAAVAQLRTLLATEPSIQGSKKPELAP